MKFGKVWVKKQKEGHKVNFCFPGLGHLACPCIQQGSLPSGGNQAAEQGMP